MSFVSFREEFYILLYTLVRCHLRLSRSGLYISFSGRIMPLPGNACRWAGKFGVIDIWGDVITWNLPDTVSSFQYFLFPAVWR